MSLNLDREKPAWVAVSVAIAVALLAVACAPTPVDEAPWKGGSVEVVTAAPDAGGPLSFRNCPTAAEAAALGVIRGEPDANAVPFKNMLLSCTYDLGGLDRQGAPARMTILVFDAAEDGVHLWDSVLGDPAFPNPFDVPGLGDRALATGTPGSYDLWVVKGKYGFHMLHTSAAGISMEQMTALAQATLAGLERPPR
ncbi:MAG: hypothetical protein FIA92_15550 [Chloroflexi bacterium]|nr:hypothetical protein [Chloroflexota bacterium]